MGRVVPSPPGGRERSGIFFNFFVLKVTDFDEIEWFNNELLVTDMTGYI